MGNRSSIPEDKKDEMLRELGNQDKNLQIIKLDKNEKKAIQMRYSSKKIDDKELRKEYFRRLTTNNKLQSEERRSRKALDSYGRISYQGEADNNKVDSPFDEISENPSKNNINVNMNMNMNLNHSYVEKSVNLSMDESSIFQDMNDSGYGPGPKYYSRDSSPKKNMIEINNKKCKDQSMTKTHYKHHKSLSDICHNEIPDYFGTRNSLFLQNDVEMNIDDDIKNIENHIKQEIIPIDLRKRRTLRKNHSSSSDHMSIYTRDISEINNPNKPSDSRSSLRYDLNDNASMFSITRNLTNINNDYELKYVKNGEELRRSYIAKLIYKKVWEPSKKEKDHNSLIIFDWDDTLLCTSFLTPNGLFNEDLILTDKDQEKLAKLEFSVLRLLTAAQAKGDTYIITNAAPGWVEYSAERFYPSVKKILDKITIISARGDYENKYPGDSRMWKIQAFLNMQKYFNYNLVTNIICLGDSFIEMEAAHVLASKFTQAFIKTIKFRESPKPEELNKQLYLVADQFPIIYSTVKNLTIRVEKKIKK